MVLPHTITQAGANTTRGCRCHRGLPPANCRHRNRQKTLLPLRPTTPCRGLTVDLQRIGSGPTWDQRMTNNGGPTEDQRRTNGGPTGGPMADQRKTNGGPTEDQRRTDVVPMADQRRTDVVPTEDQRRTSDSETTNEGDDIDR